MLAKPGTTQVSGGRMLTNGDCMAPSTIDVRLKRAYDPPATDDGVRVLVDRLWPRGIRKDRLKLAVWLREIAPTPELRSWFAHDPSRFAEFSRKYRVELDGNREVVSQLQELMKRGRVTLIYAAHDLAHNHALVLAEYLRSHT